VFIKIFSLIILVVLAIFVIGSLIALAAWPGRIARARNHPFADAINVAGWVAIVAGGVLWPLALVWAYAIPGNEPCLDYSIEEDEL
jgi:hypothetical protein